MGLDPNRTGSYTEIAESIYGDKFVEKEEENWRLVMMNINTLPSEKNKVKTDLWRNLVTTCDINVLVETNKDQKFVQTQDKTENLTKGWWKKHSVRDEYLIEERNQNEKDARQQGGVSMINTNNLLDHVCDSGGDERELGRWRWITLRGKQGQRTTIIGT